MLSTTHTMARSQDAPAGGADAPPENHVERIVELFQQRGIHDYTSEHVSQAEHALQCAHLARMQRRPDALVAAALLHDLGHMLASRNSDMADMHRDQRHEEQGAAWISCRFGFAVSEPVRLHVAAKRYLCATDDGYLARLSEASIHSLSLQGGPMNTDECHAFLQRPWHAEAIALRRLDDASKVPGLRVPGLCAYTALLDTLCGAHSSARQREFSRASGAQVLVARDSQPRPLEHR